MHALAALADPTRRRIVEILAEGDRTAGEILEHFAISAPAISQHLKVLRQARLINSRVEGQLRIQTLDRAGLDEIETWLARTRRFWEERLDTLERELLAEQTPNKPNNTNEPNKPGNTTETNEPKSRRLRRIH
jgi:DNA-binding transcriptional ArsR family regulator